MRQRERDGILTRHRTPRLQTAELETKLVHAQAALTEVTAAATLGDAVDIATRALEI